MLAMIASGMAVSAQAMKEVVHLKNGSIIKGTIIEQVPNESLKIQTADGSIFVYNISEVQKITKEEVKPAYVSRPAAVSDEDDDDDDERTSGSGLHSGFRILMETGYHFGAGEDQLDGAPLNVSLGGQIGPHFYVGGGLGLRYLYNEDDSYFAMPIFANLRWDIMDKRIIPFIDTKMGYSPFDVQGFFWQAGAGCRFRIGKKSAISASVGVEQQDDACDVTSTQIFTHFGIEF